MHTHSTSGAFPQSLESLLLHDLLEAVDDSRVGRLPRPRRHLQTRLNDIRGRHQGGRRDTWDIESGAMCERRFGPPQSWGEMHTVKQGSGAYRRWLQLSEAAGLPAGPARQQTQPWCGRTPGRRWLRRGRLVGNMLWPPTHAHTHKTQDVCCL